MLCRGIEILISLYDLMTAVMWKGQSDCGVENFLEKEEPKIKDGHIYKNYAQSPDMKQDDLNQKIGRINRINRK